MGVTSLMSENTNPFDEIEEVGILDSFFNDVGVPSTEGVVDNTLKLGSNLFADFEEEYIEEEATGKPTSTANGGTLDVTNPYGRLRGLGDSLIQGVLNCESDITRKYRKGMLFSQASAALFRDELHILYKVLYNFRDKDFKVDLEFLRMYLMRNQEVVQDSRAFIDINSHGEIDGSNILGYISGVLGVFNSLAEAGEVDQDTYLTNYEKYKVEFKALEAQNIFNEGVQILIDGRKQRGGKLAQGFDSSADHVRRGLSRIEGLTDLNMGKGFTSLQELILNPEERDEVIKIADWGLIDELNEHFGGIYTRNLISVLAPPKAGKSKFTTRIAHTAGIRYGQNVSVWAQEGGTIGFLSQLRAIHFDYLYNQGIGSYADKSLGVSQQTIMFDTFETQELRDLEAASAMELATNEDYGQFDFIDRPFEVETFLDDIDTSIKSNNSKLLVIDYLQLLNSRGNKSRREILDEAYPKLLEYVKKNNITCISPVQYTQEVVKELAKGGQGAGSELRTAGGESSQIIRSSDLILALWSSTEDLANNKMRLMSVPSRFHAPFEAFDIYCDLATCNFVSIRDGGVTL